MFSFLGCFPHERIHLYSDPNFIKYDSIKILCDVLHIRPYSIVWIERSITEKSRSSLFSDRINRTNKVRYNIRLFIYSIDFNVCNFMINSVLRFYFHRHVVIDKNCLYYFKLVEPQEISIDK